MADRVSVRLIGGPFDGQWHNVAYDRDWLRLPDRFALGPVMSQEQFEQAALEMVVKSHTYVKQIWRNPDGTQVRVFIWDGLEPSGALEHILRNWNPNSRGGEAAMSTPDPNHT